MTPYESSVAEWPETKTFEIGVQFEVDAATEAGAVDDLKAALRRLGIAYSMGDVKEVG